ncbi:hypothetical protein [uncultured Clostridium sp.]|nr:hypothetical protein [uncultured Clostridium sp.]
MAEELAKTACIKPQTVTFNLFKIVNYINFNNKLLLHLIWINKDS